MIRLVLGPLAAMLLLSGCNASTVKNADVPAVIVNADRDSQQELEQIVSTALHGADITLAADALTAASLLTIEHQPRQTLEQRPLRGRDTGTPQQFQLVIDGRQCTLVHRNTGLRWLLLDTECRAEQ